MLERFSALFRKAQPAQKMIHSPVPPRPAHLAETFAAESTRRAIVHECRAMAEEDPRVEGILKALARDTVKGGFTLSVDGARSAEAEQAALALFDRLNFQVRLQSWVEATLRDGDTFLEVMLNPTGEIADLSRKPTLEMHRHTDEFDRFVDPGRAFFWTDKLWHGPEPPSDAVWFAAWQVIHAKANEDENRRYGRPLFASARKAHKRMTEGELDLAIRRKTRAGVKYFHAVEGASEADLDAYIERNRGSLDDPFAAVQDFFSAKPGGITAIQGDANLSQIEDVLHHIRTFWVASPVPMSLLGYGQDLNRDVLDEQKEQYDAAKEQLGTWAAYQFIYPLVERQWLLRGILPKGLRYTVEWSQKDAVTPGDLQAVAGSIVQLRAAGVLSDETLVRLVARFIPELDVESELAALEQRMADEAARIAANAAMDDEDGER